MKFKTLLGKSWGIKIPIYESEVINFCLYRTIYDELLKSSKNN
jgi:hypothetical protein